MWRPEFESKSAGYHRGLLLKSDIESCSNSTWSTRIYSLHMNINSLVHFATGRQYIRRTFHTVPTYLITTQFKKIPPIPVSKFQTQQWMSWIFNSFPLHSVKAHRVFSVTKFAGSCMFFKHYNHVNERQPFLRLIFACRTQHQDMSMFHFQNYRVLFYESYWGPAD